MGNGFRFGTAEVVTEVMCGDSEIAAIVPVDKAGGASGYCVAALSIRLRQFPRVETYLRVLKKWGQE